MQQGSLHGLWQYNLAEDLSVDTRVEPLFVHHVVVPHIRGLTWGQVLAASHFLEN